MTANGGLLRSLPDSGILGVGLYVHEPRSLVENRRFRKGWKLHKPEKEECVNIPNEKEDERIGIKDRDEGI